MIARKKIIGLLLITVLLCSISIRLSAAEEKEETDVETEVELVPIEEVSSSDDYVDSKFETVFVNSDVNETTINYAKQEFNLEYNVTFEILSIDKGTFDNAIIINATSIKFVASNVAYGTNRTGEAIIRLYGSSPVGVVLLVVAIAFVIVVTAVIAGSVTIKDHFIPTLQRWRNWFRVLEAEAGEIEIEPEIVPEFPFGHLIALGMGILIIFLFRRKNMSHTTKQKRQNH